MDKSTTRELNLEEMEKVTGGGNEGGYENKPRDKDGTSGMV